MHIGLSRSLRHGGFPLVLQTAALTGAWGVEFLVVFVPAAIATISRVRQAVPVAVVIVGGLVSSTLLEFLVRPLVFFHFGREAAAQAIARDAAATQ